MDGKPSCSSHLFCCFICIPSKNLKWTRENEKTPLRESQVSVLNVTLVFRECSILQRCMWGRVMSWAMKSVKSWWVEVHEHQSCLRHLTFVKALLNIQTICTSEGRLDVWKEKLKRHLFLISLISLPIAQNVLLLLSGWWWLLAFGWYVRKGNKMTSVLYLTCSVALYFGAL